MSQSGEDRTTQPSMLVRADEIQQQIQQLSGRDLQLWSIGILVILVLTSGLLALLIPNLVWAQRVVRVEHSYLPQLFFGLISLVLLFNIYLLSQKKTLNNTCLALIRELVPREVARANRVGNSLTFMAIDLNRFSELSSKFGALEGDKVLVDFAKILKTVFRGADLAFRQSGDQFLIMMPDTTEEQADFPVQRILREVDQWNLASKKDYELSFSWALAPYVTGSDAEDVLRTVDRKMYSKKHNLTPVF